MNILKRLHHRAPYLLIDEVVEHDPSHIQVVKTASINEYYLQGHFPGAPIIPGAMMQEMTTQAAGLLIAEYYSPVPDYDSEKIKGHALGVLRAVHMAKYRSFARPNEKLTIKVKLLENMNPSFLFRARIERDGELIMTNEFTLVNISEEKLLGSAT